MRRERAAAGTAPEICAASRLPPSQRRRFLAFGTPVQSEISLLLFLLSGKARAIRMSWISIVIIVILIEILAISNNYGDCEVGPWMRSLYRFSAVLMEA
jgi:hypothetical protein